MTTESAVRFYRVVDDAKRAIVFVPFKRGPHDWLLRWFDQLRRLEYMAHLALFASPYEVPGASLGQLAERIRP